MKKNSQYIGVDDKYIPKDEKYVDDSVLGSKEESRKTIIKGVKIFGIGYMIVIGIILAIIIAAFVFSFSYYVTAIILFPFSKNSFINLL